MPIFRPVLGLFCLFTFSTLFLVQAKTIAGQGAISGDATQAAKRFVMGRLDAFGVDQVQLKVESTTPVPRGMVVRLRQLVGGLPVIDGAVSVLVQRDRIVVATGELFALPGLRGKINTTKEQAIAALLAKKAGYKVTSAQLAVASRRSPGSPVWVLKVVSLNPVGNWRVIVDAESGRLLHGITTLRHANEGPLYTATGYAYAPNPTVSEVQQVQLSRLTSTEKLEGVFAKVKRCGTVKNKLECSILAKPSQGSGAHYDYRPDEPNIADPFAEVHTYYHVDAFSHWLSERFGFARKHNSAINVYVNFHYSDGQQAFGMANAFFGDVDGDSQGDLVFGQATRDFAYDGDVVYHEYTHSVIDQTSRLEPDFDELGLNAMPLALNEAYADLISSAFTNDPQVGEYAGGSYGNMAIRDLEGKALRCPADLSGESHHDGQIWGRLVWKIRKQASDTRHFDELLYTSMVTLQRSASFADAAAVLQQVMANSGDSQLQTITEQELANSNVGESCERIIDLVTLGKHRGFTLGTSAVMGMGYVPAGLQYKIVVPDNAQAITIGLETLGGRRAADSFGAFIRKGAPISFAGREPLRDITQSNKTPTLTLNQDSEHPLEPGATYYVLPLNVSPYSLSYRISLQIELRKNELTTDASVGGQDAGASADMSGSKPDVGAGSSDKADDGCAVGGSPQGGLLWLLLLGLFATRRRK